MNKYSEILIPSYISRRAFFSIPFFFLNSIVAYYYNYQRLTALMWFLTYTSVIYWNCPKKMDLIKVIDISMAITTFYTVIFLDSYYFTPRNQFIFWISSTVCITFEFMNEFWFQHTMNLLKDFEKLENPQIQEKEKPRITFEGERLVNIDYRKIEKGKENVQIASVYLHMFFLHIFPNVVCMYCIINSPVHP